MRDCVELPETDAELLNVVKGERVTLGVSEIAAVTESAGEGLPAPVKDPMELVEG